MSNSMGATMRNHHTRKVSVPILAVCLYTVGSTAFGVPELSIDTAESVVHVPIGTVSTNALAIDNDGDTTLNWTLMDKFHGKVVKDFANPWTSARSMRYDATRNCLWLSYYYSSELKKVSTSSGSIVATKNMGSTYTRPYAIEMDGSYLWTANDTNGFIKFNLDNMSVLDAVPLPSGWTYACGMAIGDGKWYSTRYNYNDRDNIYRLNPSSGAVAQTFKDVEYFYYRYNHISHDNGGLWFGAYNGGKNAIKKFDPVLGRIRHVIQMPDWYESMNIYDQSFESSSRVWVLTYRHDYHITGTYNYRIQLLDVGLLEHLSQSADNGSVPAGESGNVDVVLDAQGASSGIHRVDVEVASDGGTETKPYVFVVHTPGANGVPTANAGPNQTIDATAPTMEVTLDGSGSTDPDGDELVYEWKEVTPTGTIIWATTPGVTIGLAPGVHDLTLTVDDYRGGIDSDTARITISAPDIEVDDLYVPVLEGSGTAAGTVTIRNDGDQPLNWSVSHTLRIPQSSVIREFEVTWKSSCSSYAYPYTMTYDATRDCLWVGYYYDDEVGRINANNGSAIETKALGDGKRVYALDMEGAYLWNADYSEKKFRKFDMDTLANPQTINSPWGTGNGPAAMARDSGQFFAAQYYAMDVSRLNAGSGAVQATLSVEPERFRYNNNHLDAINGKVWYSRYNLPRNRIHCIDGTSGNELQALEIDGWQESAYLYDLSFANSTQCWILAYNAKGDSKRWAHLVDISAGDKFSKSAGSGTVAAGGTGTFDVSLDVTGLAVGWHPVLLTFTSDDPDEPVYEKEIIFIVHEDAPNNPPTADAGPDRTESVPGVSAPFVLALSGEGSSDPDGDFLMMSWTKNGEPFDLPANGLIDLTGGVHRFVLTVDDLRGGVDTDEMLFTVNASTPWDDWPQYGGPDRNNVSQDTGWLENWPPIERWRIWAGFGYAHPVISEGRMYTHRSNDAKNGWRDDHHWVRCYDTETAELLWKSEDIGEGAAQYDHNFGWGAATPAVDDKYVYTYNNGAIVAAWDKYTGSNIWYRATYPDGNTSEDCGRGSSPLVEGDIVLIGKTALNKHTGELLWKGSYSSPHAWARAFDWEGRRWFMYMGRKTDTLTGTPSDSLGSHAGRGSMCPVLYGDNKVFDVNGVREIGQSADEWTSYDHKIMYALPTIWGDYAYIANSTGYRAMNGQHKCIRLSDGEEMWSGVAGDKLYGAMASEGKLIVSHSLRNQGNGVSIMEADPTKKNLGGRGILQIDGLLVGCYGTYPVLVDKALYINCRDEWLVKLDLGYSAPVVDNADGALWNARTGIATLKGTIANTGGFDPQAFIYWGKSDGGTDPGSWEHCESLGERGAGLFSVDVSGLDPDRTYHYRCFGSNSRGDTWAAASERFATYAESTVDVSSDLILYWSFDEGLGTRATDVSGYGNHGEFINPGTGLWTNGVVDGAVRIPCDYKQPRAVACTRLSQRLRENWTVAVWLNVLEEGGTILCLCHDEDYDYKSMFAVNENGRMSISGVTKYEFDILGAGWKHWAITRRGTDMELWENGRCVKQWTDPVQTFRRVHLGDMRTQPPEMLVDEMRIYRRGLNEAEIKFLYHLGRASSTRHDGAVTGSSDDAQESFDGTVSVGGAVLELGEDGGGGATTVGIRFPCVGIPRGARIVQATIQFAAADADSDPADLSIHGRASDDAGVFMARDIDALMSWESETIVVGGVFDISVDIRSEGNMGSDEKIQLIYVLDDGAEVLFAERKDNFNGDAWETVTSGMLSAWSVQVIIRVDNDSNSHAHYFDNVKVTRHRGSGWDAVPGFSDIPADTDRTIEYTNSTPAKTGFYRVKARLE